MSAFRRPFRLVSSFEPRGDQPQAIEALVAGFEDPHRKSQVLLGVTGSGKTFSLAHVIARLQRPTLVLSHNKTLAAQLFAEFQAFFPDNAVEYFVSYYDYYQPEAYLPSSQTYIAKDAQINQEIDQLRHSATRSLLERRDVIIVSSVSCIYGLGSPESYGQLLLVIAVGQQESRVHFLRKLVERQYTRNEVNFQRGTFRVRGDQVSIFPKYEDQRALRVSFWGDQIESLEEIDALTGARLATLQECTLFPGGHYVMTPEDKKRALGTIRDELRERLQALKQQGYVKEAERLEQRTLFDLEMIEQLGFCQGIENYSRHFTGRPPGAAPPTLFEYFPTEKWLLIVDESHVTLPQLRAMYRGDQARKRTLVDHGFRLPSALDNRPLSFEEWEKSLYQVIYVSATPGDYELEQTQGEIVEQVIRPTGLLDPVVEVRPAQGQIEDLLGEIATRVEKKERVLVTVLTKKLAEEVTGYYLKKGIKVRYLHADVETLERIELLRDLRLGIFDVLIGINLLREGLDLPEVSLVAILDADQEGFLRSERSLIQTIGRAARHREGRVILYADRETSSLQKACEETRRRRTLQEAYNRKHGIEPQTIQKHISQALLTEKKDSSRLWRAAEPSEQDSSLSELKRQLSEAIEALRFEEAARLRDRIRLKEQKP